MSRTVYLPENEVRKLRKKLRQIESLERLERPLMEDELIKVNRKSEIRSELLELLSANSDVVSSSLFVQKENDESTLNESPIDLCTVDSDESCQTASELIMKELLEKSISTGMSEVNMKDSSEKPISTGASLPSENGITDDKRDRKATAVIPKTTEPRKVKSSLKSSALREQSRPLSVAEKWRTSKFQVRRLIGHNGLITAMAIQDDILLTGSQDTTVKLWDLTTFAEIRSMCGHTDTVTAVVLLKRPDSGRLAKQLFESSLDDGTVSAAAQDGVVLSISCALDCYLRIWNLGDGSCLKSVYTFNPLTCLQLLSSDEEVRVVCGTAGGKMELWDVSRNSSCPAVSALAHSDCLTALCVAGSQIYSTSATGSLKIHELSADSDLCLLYDSDDASGIKAGGPVQGRRIHCLGISNGTIYYGDEGPNVKAFDWQSGSCRRLANHTTDFGSTSSLTTDCIRLLMTSGYDLDNGLGYVNVRSLPGETYVGSLCDEETDMIVTMASDFRPDDRVFLVTGGTELKIWMQMDSETGDSCDGGKIVNTLFIPQFDRPVHDSDAESDDTVDDDDDMSHSPLPWQRNDHAEDNGQSGWFSWCSLL